MKAHLHLSLLLVCLGSTLRLPWPLLLLLSSPPLLHLFLSSWLVPGGFAWHRWSSQPTPPGPPGWPFLGSLLAMAGDSPHRRLAELASSLGATRLMALSLGPTRLVLSSHPDTAREILCTTAFGDRPPKLSATLLMFDRAIGFSPSLDDHWRRLRGLVMRNLFSPRGIAATETTRRRVAAHMIARVENAMTSNGVVELRSVLQRGSLESIVSVVLGDSLDAAELEELREVVWEGYDLVGTFNLEDYIPLGGLLDFQDIGPRCKLLATRVKRLVGDIIDKRRRTAQSGGDEDFLHLLLSLPEKDRLCDSDMIAVLWEMIFRGADVVAILMEWVMARLVVHPEIQARVRGEVRRLKGAVPVEDSDVPRLRYLQAVVSEVLRLHPPGPLLSWARMAVRDVVVDKTLVPAGTAAMVNMWAITHDSSVWEDPWAFRPERFSDRQPCLMGTDLRLSPFGSGQRVCPARSFALAAVHLWLARLLQDHVWLPCGTVHLAERLRLSMEMKKPLLCRTVPVRDV